jgi:DNA replication protein DnaC
LNDEERREMAWKQLVESRINASNIPRHTRGRGVADLEATGGNQKAFALVEDFLEGKIDPPLLLLIGIPGVGKTTLAYAAAWRFLEDGDRVIYFQAEELLNELQSFLEDSKAYGYLWARLKEADLVVLDDLAAQNRTPWRDAQLDALVDYRYRERRPLPISERILDRVKEGASAVITGESWRGKGK